MKILILIYKYLGSIVLAMFVLFSSNEVFGEENSSILGYEMRGLKVGVFDVDATPPIGSPLAYDPVINTWDMGLRAKGIVLLGTGEPVVLLSLDWIGVYGDNHDEFRRSIADAAKTTIQRVAVHSVHQHDAPRGDIRNDFVLATLQRIQMAVRQAIDQAQPVTHYGFGEAEVYKVASNRRIMGDDGKVRATRYTASADPELRAEPEGLIDPMVSVISFWNDDVPVAVLSSYATHPQSYYRTGIPNPDFPGIARFFRQLAVPEALHVHFTGAGGNIGAGKYNDGSHENRFILAERLADGMKRAWEATTKKPLILSEVEWKVEPVSIMPDTTKDVSSGRGLTLLQKYESGQKVDIGCLAMGESRMIFMPGELFVEYQIAAKEMRPDLFVAMAAYGDGAPGYIPVASAFSEGGYEIRVTRLTPEIENVLMTAIRRLLN